MFKKFLYGIGSIFIVIVMVMVMVMTIFCIYYANSHFQLQILKQKQTIQELYADMAIMVGEEESLRLTSTLIKEEKDKHDMIMHNANMSMLYIYRLEDYEYASNLIDDALNEHVKLNETSSSSNSLTSDSLNIIDSVEAKKAQIEQEKKIFMKQKTDYNKFYKNFKMILKFVENVKKFF